MIQKSVANIDCPKEWEAMDDWGSHLPLLWLSLNKTDSGTPFTEFGCGFKSTPMLADFCVMQDRFFEYVDTDKEWIKSVDEVLRNMGLYPESQLVKSCLDVDSIGSEILFVDSKPGEERKDIIAKWQYICPIIIVHDSEEGANYVYGMQEILSTFKYRLDFQPQGKPHTTAVSNYIDVTNWV